MSFINKSVNYSQSNLLKTKILAPILNSYNNFLLKNNKTSINIDIDTGISLDYLIPNNNKKYYLLITKKSMLETTKENYNILYFLPDDKSIEYYSNNNIIKNTLTDQYLECSLFFKDTLLLEGYLYKNMEKNEYLITDILSKNGNIIELSYELRLTLLNEIILDIKRECLKDINDHMTINIHPTFQKTNENMIKIFTHNFIYKNELCCIEQISQFTKCRFVSQFTKEDALKKIECTSYTDVYNVFNYSSNNKEGILYIRGIKHSKYIKSLFENEKTKTDKVIIKCCYNTNFMKWEPILF
jgi:hypothetical protein